MTPPHKRRRTGKATEAVQNGKPPEAQAEKGEVGLQRQPNENISGQDKRELALQRFLLEYGGEGRQWEMMGKAPAGRRRNCIICMVRSLNTISKQRVLSPGVAHSSLCL